MSSMNRNDLLAVSLVLTDALDVLNLLSDEATGKASDNLNMAARNVQEAITFIQAAMAP